MKYERAEERFGWPLDSPPDIDHPPEDEREERSLRVDAVLDIETESWDRFVLGGIMDADRTYRSTRDQDELVEWLLQRGGHVWTWNGGLFDSLWLAQRLRSKGLRFTAALAGPRVTRLECEGLVVRDAVALVPMSLKKAATMAGIDLAKDTGLPCRCGEACGGYCAIRRDMPARDFDSLDKYLRADCAAALDVLDVVIAEAARCGFELAGTIGGTSYKNLSRLAGLEPAKWPDAATYELARSGYYGGRVEVYRPQAASGFAYDINSAYPAALTKVALPVGEHMTVTGAKAQRAFARGKEGIYVARVEVPADMHLPPLPVRTPGGRVVYPVGTFAGAWTGLELRGALERGCAAVVDRALVWGDSELVMAGALLAGWGDRARARDEGNLTLAAWHKWRLNSFTGKLAEAPDKERIICNPHEDEVRVCRLEGWCRARRKNPRAKCRCGSFRPLDRQGQMWAAPFWRLSACSHVHFAAYLTAWTRMTLLAQLEDDGDGGRSAVYCDTDSVKATSPRSRDIGDALGWWKDEGEFRAWLALAPKVYRYTDAAGKTHVRGKGLPGLTADGFAAFAAGDPVVVERGVMALRQAARRGGELFARRRLERRSHADGRHFGGRILGEDGLTHPLRYSEVVAWEKSER